MTRTARADQVARRRTELLESAHRVVLERGLANTRIADVATAANVSGGLVHYHFATKDVLLTETLRWAATKEIARARRTAEGAGSAAERLDKVLRQYVPLSGTDDSWLLWIDAWGAGLRDAALRAIIDELDTAWTDVIEGIVRDGRDAAEFDCDDPAGVASRLCAMLDGLGLRHTLARAGCSRPRMLAYARRAVALELGVPVSRAKAAG